MQKTDQKTNQKRTQKRTPTWSKKRTKKWTEKEHHPPTPRNFIHRRWFSIFVVFYNEKIKTTAGGNPNGSKRFG